MNYDIKLKGVTKIYNDFICFVWEKAKADVFKNETKNPCTSIWLYFWGLLIDFGAWRLEEVVQDGLHRKFFGKEI